jgi:hypothetical protein
MKNIFLIVCFFSSAYFTAQNNQGGNELDKKYTPPENSIFNSANKSNVTTRGSNDITIKNAIKLFPTMLFRQKVLFAYERSIVNGFTLQFGIGKSFGKDFLELVYFQLKDDSYDVNSPSFSNIMSSSNYSSSSPYIAFGAKAFFSGISFDGMYAELNFRSEKIDYTLVQNKIDGYPVTGSTRFSSTYRSVNFGLGYAGYSGAKNNITHDFYIQIGIRSYQSPIYQKYEVPFSQYGGSTIYYQNTNQTESGRLLGTVAMGYVFGFGF